MALGHIHASKHSLFWGLLCLSILIYVIPQKTTNSLNFLFHRWFAPLLQIGRQLPSEVSDTSAIKQTVDISQYNLLWKNYKNLQAQMTELEKENLTLSRIRKQYGFSKTGLLPAQITTLVRSTRHELIVNQGTEQGAAAGQLVLSPQKDSVIGIIKEASQTMARIGLLTDSSVSIEVRIRRDGTPLDISAQMFGDGKNGCLIRFIPRDKDIRKGDAVYAAARPGKLDVPIIIGQIRDVRADEKNPLLWSISVEPIEQVASLSQVIILAPLTQ